MVGFARLFTGLPKLVWLNALKNSARNSMASRSCIRKSFEMLKSKV